METLLDYVEWCEVKGEELVVVIRNKTTGEEIETTVSPGFIADISRGGK